MHTQTYKFFYVNKYCITNRMNNDTFYFCMINQNHILWENESKPFEMKLKKLRQT